MRNFGLTVAVFAMSFALSAIAFVQTNKSSNQKQSPQKTQATKQTASKQEVRCPVSGKVITDTNKAPKYAYRGKTYYFNCQSCLAEFKKNPDKYVKQAAAVRTVSNAPAKKEGESCCNSAEKAAGASCCSGGEKATASASCCSDKKEAQTTQTAAAAPANKLMCPVSGEELTEADAVRFTYNGKVYYTCCNGCKNKFLKDPETYAKKAEQLSALQGKPEKADTN
ncbi:MAG: YHS domain-containing protein [Fimbriimonadales bacterium]|nr:MAG: hypothetical protein KatS3mg018_0443 [Fimbriimonadales bacterium]